MDLQFATSRLERAFRSEKEAMRLHGEAIGKKYVKALQLVKQARDRDELRKIPQLHFHALEGDREDEYGVTLTANWRLVLTFPEDGAARVEKVEDYHGR